MPAPKRSKIGFTDYSAGDLNFVLGCTPISAGCEHCYARRLYKTFGKDFSQVTIYPEKLEHLLKWQPKPPYKRGLGSKPLAFVVDMGDLFHDHVPDEFIQQAFDTMADRSDVDWLVLTKRAMRMRMLLMDWCSTENVWLGVSVENEDNLWRIGELMDTPLDVPATMRWISLEPMLGPIDLTSVCCRDGDHLGTDLYNLGLDVGIDWVVIGAESGPKRRPFKKEWAWDVLDQCREAGIPVFLKQDSGRGPSVPLLDRQGREVKEWPG